MKLSILLIIFSLTIINPAIAETEKSRIKSEQSFLGKGLITYQGNVSYEHANLRIQADKLIRENKERKKITVNGNPAKVFYTDNKGETTEIVAPAFFYWEDSGEILADGPINIKQTSKRDRLKLSGNKLKANRSNNSEFSFELIGSPTQFQLQQPDQETIEATANRLSSNGKGRQTFLNGNVKLRQGDSYMAAAKVTYNGETGLVSAEQSQDGSQRVETEFFWDKKEEPSQKQP